MAPSTSTTRSANQAAVAASTSFTVALVSGGLAGTSVDTLFFPIDTLKTRAQSRQGFFAAGGFSGVYRGLGSAVVGSAPGGMKSLSLFSPKLRNRHAECRDP